MMKYARLILLNCLAIAALSASAQTDVATPTLKRRPDPVNTIKFNLLSPFYQNLNISFQHMVTEDDAIQIGASYMDYDGAFFNNSTYGYENEATKMFSFTPEYRLNLTGMNLSGIYFSAFSRYINMSYAFDESNYRIVNGIYTNVPTHSSYSYSSLGLGMLIGTQMVFKRRITFDAFAGPVYGILLQSSNSVTRNGDIHLPDGISPLLLRGYGVRAGICVGIAF